MIKTQKIISIILQTKPNMLKYQTNFIMQKQKIKEKNQLIFKLVRALDPFNKNKNIKQILKRLSQLTSSQIQFIQSGVETNNQSNFISMNNSQNNKISKKKVTFILDKSYRPTKKLSCKSDKMLNNANESLSVKKQSKAKASSQFNNSILNKRTFQNQLKNVHNDLINLQSQVQFKFSLSSRQHSSDIAETQQGYHKNDSIKMLNHIRSNSANQQVFQKSKITDKYENQKGRFNSAKLPFYGSNKEYLNEIHQNKINQNSLNPFKQEGQPIINKKSYLNNPQNMPFSESRLMKSSLLTERNTLPLESILGNQKYLQENKTNSISIGQQTKNEACLKNYRSVDNLNKRMVIKFSEESQLKRLYFNDHLTLKVSKDQFREGDSNLQIFKNKLIDKIQQNKIQQRYNTLKCRK